MNFRDVELLSSYLDGQLSPSDAARLEFRLSRDPALQHALDDLRASRTLLRALPKRGAPRNFTLRPAMKKLAAPQPRLFPVLRLASVMASLLFAATLAFNSLAPAAAPHFAAASAPAYGIGGGPPAESNTAPIGPTEAAPQALMGIAPTPAAALPVAPPSDQQSQAAKAPPLPRTAPLRPAPASPAIPALWEWIFAAAAVASGLSAWYLHQSSARRFRSRWMDK